MFSKSSSLITLLQSKKNSGYQKTAHIFKEKDRDINQLKMDRKEAGETT